MKNQVSDYVKANRKGARDAELELTHNGWVSKNKVHKSKKNYSRKLKHKGGSKSPEFGDLAELV